MGSYGAGGIAGGDSIHPVVGSAKARAADNLCRSSGCHGVSF